MDMMLGMVALSRGDLVAAHDHLIVALRSRMSFGFHLRVCETLNAIAVRCACALASFEALSLISSPA